MILGTCQADIPIEFHMFEETWGKMSVPENRIGANRVLAEGEAPMETRQSIHAIQISQHRFSQNQALPCFLRARKTFEWCGFVLNIQVVRNSRKIRTADDTAKMLALAGNANLKGSSARLAKKPPGMSLEGERLFGLCAITMHPYVPI